MIREKIAAIQRELRRTSIPVLILISTPTVHDDYLFYLTQTNFEHALILIPARGRSTLSVGAFEVPMFQTLFPELRVVPLERSLADIFLTAVKSYPRLGIHERALPFAMTKSLTGRDRRRLIDCNLDRVMAKKLDSEIRLIAKACRKTDELFSDIIAQWHRFSSEVAVADYIVQTLAANGLTPSFPPIIASGRHAADPHHMPVAGKLKRGFCVIDMGVRIHGYCSDMTRTLFLGTPTTAELSAYDTVRTAQTVAIQAIAPGVHTNVLDALAREALGPIFSPLFIHALGHGIGTAVHEWPRVSNKSPDTLEQGMTIAIEPGVYQPNRFGIRLEDTLVVTRNGSRFLTQSRRDLIVIKK